MNIPEANDHSLEPFTRGFLQASHLGKQVVGWAAGVGAGLEAAETTLDIANNQPYLEHLGALGGTALIGVAGIAFISGFERYVKHRSAAE